MPFINYSTVEQDTGVLWVDGKPIFQITILTSLAGLDPPPDEEFFAHGITLDTLVDAVGAVQDTPLTEFLPLPRSGTGAPTPPGMGSGTQALNLDAFLDAADLRISSTTDYSAFSGFVTLLYTKP